MAQRTVRFSSWIIAVFAALVVCGPIACSSPPETDDPSEADEVVERPDPDFSQPPADYSTGEIVGVFAVPRGAAVMLGSANEQAVLPIFIDPSQAMAIELGLEDETFERPLTHDLVDNILGKVDAEIGKIQVDALREGTFYATIFLITADDVIEVDARPSDALALAVKDDVPLYVADQVMEQAGMGEDDLDELPPADPGEPEDFDDSPTTPL